MTNLRTHEDVKKQDELIQKWAEQTAFAYSIELDDVTDRDIVTYLAQLELGYHKDNV